MSLFFYSSRSIYIQFTIYSLKKRLNSYRIMLGKLWNACQNRKDGFHMDEIEHRVYKKRAILIAATELLIGIVLKLMGLDNLFVAVVYSFAVLWFMLVAGKVKNHWSIAP